MNRSTSLVVVLVTLLFSLVNADADVDKFMKIYPHANRKALEELKAMNPIIDTKTNASVPVPLVMACPSIPLPADTDNVNNLRPGNIKVVMAMGDSITAAMSAKDSTFLSLKEYRGISYSIGGDSGVTTMPNILSSYLANAPIGVSKGVGERSMKTNGLNAAVSGAINIDLLEQAKWLVQQLQADSSINIQKDWKLLTIWIGSNNLCDVCDNEDANDADNFEQYVTEAIQYIKENVPRVFVNLAVNLDITQLDNIQEGLCDFLHGIACGCVTSSRQEVYAANIAYQQRAQVIAAQFTGSDFAVVVQPFLEKTAVLERSELSAGDCFHPSAYSHGVAAIALWNNMISPANQKKTAWSLTDVPLCATSDTLLYTN